jgi:hypothetical protein
MSFNKKDTITVVSQHKIATLTVKQQPEYPQTMMSSIQVIFKITVKIALEYSVADLH